MCLSKVTDIECDYTSCYNSTNVSYMPIILSCILASQRAIFMIRMKGREEGFGEVDGWVLPV